MGHVNSYFYFFKIGCQKNGRVITNFVEHQRITDQRFIRWSFRFAWIVYSFGIGVGIIKATSLMEAFVVIFILTLLLYYTLYKLKMTTEIRPSSLLINHPFIGEFSLTFKEIAKVELIKNAKIPNNRRIFHKKFGTMYKMYGYDGILVINSTGRKFFIGSQVAEELHAAALANIKLAKNT